MSSIPNVSSTPSSALFPTSIHAHGHKRGAHADAVGNSSDDATQAPGAVQNLFGSLLQSLEQVVGLLPGVAPAATAAATAGAAATTSAAAGTSTTGKAAATAGAGAGAIHTANALVQNYLNNLSLKQQASAAQVAKAAGSTVNAAA